MRKESFNPGTYYIGDPCYAIKDTLWPEFCNNLFKGETLTDGAVFPFKGHQVMAGGTKYGDGLYEGHFCVDSGTIGIIPIELISKRDHEELNKLGRIMTFDSVFIVSMEDGFFTFGDIIIDTDDEVDEDLEDEWQDEDDMWDDDDEEN